MFVLRYVLVIDYHTFDLGDKFCHICWVCQPIIASSEKHGGDSQLCHIVAWWCGLVCRGRREGREEREMREMRGREVSEREDKINR